MSSNPYINYYVNQAGSGIGGFQGARFQRGQGWFGNLFKNAILPLLKYIGPKIIKTGASVATDAIAGENVLQSLKTHGKSTAKDIAGDVGERAARFVQTGKGKRRRSVRIARFAKRRRITSPKRLVEELSIFDGISLPMDSRFQKHLIWIFIQKLLD